VRSVITPAERDAHNAEHNAIPAQKAYCVAVHRYGFQAGTPAEIIGVKVVSAPTPRPCYHLRYPDGREGYLPVTEVTHHTIISQEQLEAGDTPPVIH